MEIMVDVCGSIFALLKLGNRISARSIYLVLPLKSLQNGVYHRAQAANVRKGSKPESSPNKAKDDHVSHDPFLSLFIVFSLMPRRAQQVPSELKLPGVPDFRNGIAEWNIAWESLSRTENGSRRLGTLDVSSSAIAPR